MNFRRILLFFGFLIALGAQADMEQRPSDGLSPESMEARPAGGFSKSVSGKWNCGDFGTMTLTDKKGKVTGKYTYENGTVTGTVRNNVFSGTWKQGKVRGVFEFHVSIERMATKPTNLRGKWKYQGEVDWQESPWECSR